MEKKLDKRYVFLIYAALVLATLIAYEPVRHNDFVDYDDDIYVTNNPTVQMGLNSESLIWAFSRPHVANWHPLTLLSHMLDCHLFGLKPFWHHLTSLLFHTANTLLLFWIFKRMTGLVWPGAFTAAVFALHPLHVESVAWVAERKDVLSGFFWMLTIAAYIRYTENRCVGRYLFVFFAFGLGLMAKSMLVTLPFVLLLLDYWPLDRFQWERENIRHLISEKIPLFILTLFSSIIAFIAQQGARTSEIGIDVSLSGRISNAIVSYLVYILKTIYPTRLAVLYPHPGNNIPVYKPIVAFIILAAISAGVIYMARRRRYLVMGWFWYLGTLVPVIGFVQIGLQAMADRYTYLPSIGFFIMVAWGVSELFAKRRYRRVGFAIAAGFALVGMLVCTRLQLRHWRNSETLFKHAISVTKNNFTMHYNYGKVLSDKSRFEDALVHFNQALQINPRDYDARSNKGLALLDLKKYDEATLCFKEALALRPGHYETILNMGLVMARQGKFTQAVEHFNTALEMKPYWPRVHYNLGLALTQMGRLDDAFRHLTKALYIKLSLADVDDEQPVVYNPYNEIDKIIEYSATPLKVESNYAAANYILGEAMFQNARINDALKCWTIALLLNPDNHKAHNSLGKAFYQLDKTEQAVEQWMESIRLNPDDAESHFNLGEAFADQDKLDESVKHFNEALRIKPRWPDVRYNLGNIYYRQGRFDLSVKQYAEALRFQSDFLEARLGLARSFTKMGKTKAAVENYYRILKREPDRIEVLNDLAWILAVAEDPDVRNPVDAVKFAQSACNLTKYRQPEKLDTLAAAYAAAGNFTEAVSTAEKAIELAEATGKKELAQQIQGRIELYKAGQPYHKILSKIFPD
ncbi:MAG: tetratricopeptide repeat protein [Planctomycetota bacterium]|jgi:tetratricopeptide (TPR) repeat protein